MDGIENRERGSTERTSGGPADERQGSGAAAGDRQVAESPREAAEEAVRRARDTGREQASRAKDTMSERTSHAADAMGSAAEHLRASGDTTLAAGASEVAQQLGRAARWLEEHSVDDLLHEAGAVARRNPMLFVAGSVAAGFALSRFFKASQANDGAQRGRGDRYGQAESFGEPAGDYTSYPPSGVPSDPRSGAQGEEAQKGAYI